MTLPDWPVEALKTLPGVLGSLVASMFFKEVSWRRRWGMFLAGAAISYYGGAWAAAKAGLEQGFAGFLLGLFGMAFVQKVFEMWETFDLTSILRDWLRKVAGLPAKET